MKLKFIFSMMLGVAMVSCAGNAEKAEKAETAEAEATEVNTLSVEGKWRLVDCAGDTEMIQCDSTQNYYLVLNPENHTFGMNTDCNSIGGEYKLVGDSLTFSNIACTQMACPDSKVEDNMKQILQRVDTYTITPDSALLLRGDARIFATFKFAE